MKIAILSFYSGTSERGVETWAANLKYYVKNVDILPGFTVYNPFRYLQYDIIVPTGGRLEALLCRIFAWIAGKSVIIFGHSGPGADDKWNLWCSPNVFVAFSSAQAAWANKFKLPWTKMIIIPHAVDTKMFVPNGKIKKTADVLCVAANSPDKRVDLVRRAVKSLMVVGSGQETQVPFEKMPQVYNQAKVFCFVPQPWEAFGLVFLEAMACNLPVITIDDPVRREIVGDAGVFIKNPEDIAELATAIKLALKMDWKNKPRQQAEKFSWAKIARLYDLCFHNC